MNTLPIEVINRITDPLDFDSIKNLGTASRELYRAARWSPKHLPSYLSSYFTKELPEDEKTAEHVRLHIKDVFKAIKENHFSLERPFAIRGKRLQELQDSVDLSTKPLICLKLLINDRRDITITSESQNSPLLPYVRSVEYRFTGAPSFEDEDSDSDSDLFDSLDRRAIEHHLKFLALLEKIPSAGELILRSTLDVSKYEFSSIKPCPSIKEVQIHHLFVAFDESKAAQFLKKFPKVEKLTLHGFYCDPKTGPGEVAKDSSVKELCFIQSTIKSPNLKYLLKTIPTVEKIVLYQHKNMNLLLEGFYYPPMNPVESVKEFHISGTNKDPNTKDLEHDENFLEKLYSHFPNLQNFIEIETSDEKKSQQHLQGKNEDQT